MHLAIYETTHHETLPAILELGEMYFENITVFVCNDNFLPEELVQQFSGSGKVVFEKKITNESNRKFIGRMFNLIKRRNITHLHISTFDNNRLLFSLFLLSHTKLKTSISIQAINEYRSKRFSNFKMATESLAKNILHKKIKHYRVFLPQMKIVMKDKFPDAAISFIPSAFYKEAGEYKKAVDCFTIVIPGSIDENRRNYEDVIDILQQLQKKYSGPQKIKIVLAGTAFSAKGEMIRETIGSMQTNLFEIVTFKKYLSQSEYDEQLNSADILWSPLQLHTIYKSVDEVYGTTTATGLTADMLVHPKPTLLPAGFVVPQHYNDAIILYKDESALVQLLLSFINNPSLLIVRNERIQKAFTHFNTSSFTKNFEDIIVQNN